jgi:uncharacterized RDD family membrane protein YckC
LWIKIIQYLLDYDKFKLEFSEKIFMNSMIGSACFIVLFFLIIIPVAFFNTSFGKKILGLRIRGNEKYTLTISEAFLREFILKPLSVILIAGFITPFYTKKRLSIHDMLSGTFVIDEN